MRWLGVGVGHAPRSRASILFQGRIFYLVIFVQKSIAMKPMNVGLLGIGTVGGGTFSVLRRNGEEISRRAGRAILIKAVADKDLSKARLMVDGSAEVVNDAFELVSRPD